MARQRDLIVVFHVFYLNMMPFSMPRKLPKRIVLFSCFTRFWGCNEADKPHFSSLCTLVLMPGTPFPHIPNRLLVYIKACLCPILATVLQALRYIFLDIWSQLLYHCPNFLLVTNLYKWYKHWLPSKGGIGNKLKKARIRFTSTKVHKMYCPSILLLSSSFSFLLFTTCFFKLVFFSVYFTDSFFNGMRFS